MDLPVGALRRILYKNHRGTTAWRLITPYLLWRGKTEWHPEEQWLLDAYDHEKAALRTFALKDVQEVRHQEPDWTSRATQYTVEHGEDDYFTIERRAPDAWAAVKAGLVLDKSKNEFVYEPFPSSRTDEFLAVTRFASKEEAYAALQAWLAAWVRVGPGWLRRDEVEITTDENGTLYKTARGTIRHTKAGSWCRQDEEGV